MEQAFEEFWKVKPKRKGSNPKEQARLKFLRHVENGMDPQLIIGAARAWAKQEQENGKEGTEYVAMAVTWLNQKRFGDYEPIKEEQTARWDEIAAKHGYIWNGDRYVKEEANAM